MTEWAVTVAVVVTTVHGPVSRIWILQHGIGNRGEVIYGAGDGYTLWRFGLGACTPSNNTRDIVRYFKIGARSKRFDYGVDAVGGQDMRDDIGVILIA